MTDSTFLHLRWHVHNRKILHYHEATNFCATLRLKIYHDLPLGFGGPTQKNMAEKKPLFKCRNEELHTSPSLEQLYVLFTTRVKIN